MVRTKGDLCGLTVRTEAEYGIVNASGTSAYAGTTLTLTDRSEKTEEGIEQCGSRVDADTMVISTSTGYSATFNHVRDQGWEEWIVRAIGALTGVQRELPSFDTAIRIDPSTVHLWTGCRVDTLGISAASPGAKLEFSVGTVARWHTKTPFQDSDGDTIIMDTVPIPTGIPITFNRPWEYSTNGTTFTKIPAKAFNLSISNALASDPGISDEDGTGYGLEAGEGSAAQDCTITLDLTITSKDNTWDDLRMALTKGMTFRTVIDGHTVTLTGCSLGLSNPDRSQGQYDETIAVTALDMSVV